MDYGKSGNHGYTEDYKIVRIAWYEVNANTAGWTGGGKTMKVTLLSSSMDENEPTGKIITAKGYRQISAAAKIKDGTIVTAVKKNTDGTTDVTVDKPLIEQVAIKTNERIIIRFIATSQSEIKSQYGASESMLTGKGYQANILKNNAFSGYATIRSFTDLIMYYY